MAIKPLKLAIQREANALVFKGDARLDDLARWSCKAAGQPVR